MKNTRAALHIVSLLALILVSSGAGGSTVKVSERIRSSRARNALLCENVSTDGCRLVDQGRASCYGPGLDGHKLARGGTLDRYGMTAAHRTMRLPTQVVIVNSTNGKACHAVVNDRGPYVYSREADLAQGLFEELSGVRGCNGEVKVKIYDCSEKAASRSSRVRTRVARTDVVPVPPAPSAPAGSARSRSVN